MAVILFSPVGGTDPISQSNMRDGSMLHICRFYKPDKVILYMSKEVLDNQNKDDRYRYCLNKLSEMTGQTMDIDIIERPDLANVQEFDFFYNEFREILQEIFHSMDREDQLYLNISSGTPAMKSALLVLQTIGEFNSSSIQVSTPVRKMNEHNHKGYDVELLWELNEDNDDSAENRCQIVKCPTLSIIQKEDIIKKHILAYDYPAAVAVAETLPEKVTVKYINLLKMGAARVQLDLTTVDKILKEENFECLPIRESNKRKYMEYGLGLELKLRKEEYVDFIRAITPLVVDLFVLVLEKQCSVKISDYTVKTERGRRWSEYKLQQSEKGKQIWRVLQEAYNNSFRFNDSVYAVHLKHVINALSKDVRLNKLVDDLRNVEEHIRNDAAHEIVSVTDVEIKNRTGFTGNQIMQKIKDLYAYTALNVKTDYWNSYNDMNQGILERMK